MPRHVWVQKGLFFDAGSGSFDSVPHFRYAYFKPGALFEYFRIAPLTLKSGSE